MSHLTLPAEIIKHIFYYVQLSDYIYINKVCKYWQLVLNTLPMHSEKIHFNAYLLNKNYKMCGSCVLFEYKYTSDKSCLNLFIDIFNKNKYAFTDDNIHLLIKKYDQLFNNIIDENHTYCPTKDLQFVKSYLSAHYGYCIEYNGSNYKIRYHRVYSSILTQCIMKKHIYVKYLLLLKVKICHFARYIVDSLNNDIMTLKSVIECLDFLLSFQIISVTMLHVKINKYHFKHKEAVCAHLKNDLSVDLLNILNK